jgi:chemotaxis protein CheX
MNVSYINPFIISTIETFKTMLRTEIVPGKPIIKQKSDFSHDVSGIIGLSGGAQGCIAMSFPSDVALKSVSAMLGTEIKEMGEDLTDGIGEIANIVAGNAKQHLKGLNLNISLPNVVVGKNHMLGGPKGIPTIIIPFTSALGEFTMEVQLKTT